MKTVGITAEYNPFHNGHLYHIQQARQLSGADCVAVVMSGCFTQRGEPALSSKWERAKAAVSAAPQGADLVLELPFAFACSRAALFARGAVDMLVRLGADCISFGCEAENPDALRTIASVLVSDEDRIGSAQNAFLKEGHSGAKAYELAVHEVAGEEAAGLLLEPNNILAVEYLKRIQFWRGRGLSVEDLPVRRYGSGYHDAAGDGTSYAGAGAIRTMMREGADISTYVPGQIRCEDMDAVSDRYLKLLKGAVLRSSPEQLSRICGVGEGLENKILREIRKNAGTEELVASLTSRRYTQATIRRALTHILTGSTWEEIDALTSAEPGAGRLLAANEAGRRFMRDRADDAFTIITNMNREEEKLDSGDRKLLALDEKAADIYNLLCGRDIYSASDRVTRPYIE